MTPLFSGPRQDQSAPISTPACQTLKVTADHTKPLPFQQMHQVFSHLWVLHQITEQARYLFLQAAIPIFVATIGGRIRAVS
jgi:hypothetical protein